MPDPVKLIATIKQASRLQRDLPGRSGKWVDLRDCDEVLIVGDLHGNLSNFKLILQLANLGEHPRRHVVLQELVHGPYRYPNEGGELSHRLVDVVCAYICQYPGRVHYLLGNHELAQWTRREIAKNNESLNQQFIMGVSTAYPEHVDEVVNAYDELFESLPVAIRLPNRVMLSHSLPGAARLETWSPEMLKKPTFSEEDYKLGGCVHALVWGRDTSDAAVRKYLELVDCNILISGHIPCDNGFSVPNAVQIIIDGKDEQARVILLKTDRCYSQAETLDQLIVLNQESK